MTIKIDLTEKRGSAKDHAIDESERKILESNLKDKDIIIYYLGAYAGMRVTEIEQCRLSWLNYKEFSANKVLAINIPSKDKDVRNKKVTRNEFNSKSRLARTTYIFDPLIANDVYNFYKYNPDGLYISRQRIHARVKAWNKYLGRDENTIHPHALRSSAQNLWKFEYKHDDIFIQLCFGWKDANTMLQHYRTMNKASGESYLKGVLNQK